MDDVVIRSRIKEFRARKDLTQAELADLVNVRRETIGHIEKNRYNLSLKLAYRIARALDSSIEETFLFDETEQK